MAEYNEIEDVVIPDSPKVIEGQAKQIYVPIAAYDQKGIAQFDSTYFEVVNGKVFFKKSLIEGKADLVDGKIPTEQLPEATGETSGIVKFDTDAFIVLLKVIVRYINFTFNYNEIVQYDRVSDLPNKGRLDELCIVSGTLYYWDGSKYDVVGTTTKVELPGISSGYAKNSIVGGEDSSIQEGSDNSIAFGKSHKIPGDYPNVAIFGKYSDWDKATEYGNPLLVVGNGTSDDDRNNALVVTEDGDVYANGLKLVNIEEISDIGDMSVILQALAGLTEEHNNFKRDISENRNNINDNSNSIDGLNSRVSNVEEVIRDIGSGGGVKLEEVFSGQVSAGSAGSGLSYFNGYCIVEFFYDTLAGGPINTFLVIANRKNYITLQLDNGKIYPAWIQPNPSDSMAESYIEWDFVDHMAGDNNFYLYSATAIKGG